MKLILKSSAEQKLALDSCGKSLHNKLKNLGFEESGHTGFQAELTQEQIMAIEQVAEKEDKTNKADIFMGTEDEATQKAWYPSVKGCVDFVNSRDNLRLI
ncbi:MAG: hypothetical protein WCX81_03375, partial [Monoglobales bacterium]